jgi:hypothetical protein
VPSLEKSRLLVYETLVCQVSSYRPATGSGDYLNETTASTDHRFKFNKHAELFVGMNYKAPSVVPVRVNNPDRSPARIKG